VQWWACRGSKIPCCVNDHFDLDGSRVQTREQIARYVVRADLRNAIGLHPRPDGSDGAVGHIDDDQNALWGSITVARRAEIKSMVVEGSLDGKILIIDLFLPDIVDIVSPGKS
jgi:hypothetical protein